MVFLSISVVSSESGKFHDSIVAKIRYEEERKELPGAAPNLTRLHCIFIIDLFILYTDLHRRSIIYTKQVNTVFDRNRKLQRRIFFLLFGSFCQMTEPQTSVEC